MLKLGLVVLLGTLSIASGDVQFKDSLFSSSEYPSNDAFVDHDYDMLTLAQSWPQASCWSLNNKWPSPGEEQCSACQMPKALDTWTVHGLWPSKIKGKHPFHCNKHIKFNPELFSSSLRTQMEERWPSFNLKMRKESFWGHEWSKHGTCALDLELTNSIPKYFSKVLRLSDRYSMGKVLAEAGIVPGKNYKLADITGVIGNTLGVKAYVKCTVNKASDEQHVTEVSICFDKSFQLMDCSKEHQSNCKPNDNIVYPKNLRYCASKKCKLHK